MKHKDKVSNIADKFIRRKSNMELLRVISMLMIIAHHFSVHGGFEFSTNSLTVNRLWIQFIQMGGKIGVNIFGLISGYFSVTAKSIKISKILKLWMQILTYSGVIFIIFVITGIEQFEIKELIKNFLPIIFSQWWFVTTYFVLYLMQPYINILLCSLEKRKYQRLLLLLILGWCIIPTFTGRTLECNALLWFIFLYSCAGYIKLHGFNTEIKTKSYISTALIAVLFTFLLTVIFDIVGTKIAFFGEHATYFYEMHSLPIVIISSLLFLGFLKLNIGFNKIINVISSATFGVYLIHDNSYVRSFLWEDVFMNASYYESNLLIPYSILVIVLVFVVCTVIELARSYTFEVFFSKRIDTIAKKMEFIIDKI